MFYIGKKRVLGRIFSGDRRGQFTLFIIVGLVIFAVFAFALYARAKTSGMVLTAQADLQIKDYINKNSINQYVTGCLDAVGDDAFILASMQGGMINSSGKVLGQDYIVYNDTLLNRSFNVSITIDANYNCPDNRSALDFIVTEIPGPYPYNCHDVKVDELPNLYMKFGNDVCRNNCTISWDYSGFFGVNDLPILCDSSGANSPGIVKGKNSQTCDYYDYQGNSLQKKLQDKITSDIGNCINFSEVLKRTPSNISMVGDVNTTIIFSRDGFTIRLTYPFTVMMFNKQPVTRMVDFSTDRSLPFKELYDYAYELSNYEVKDARFNIFSNRSDVLSNSIRRSYENIYDSRFLVDVDRKIDPTGNIYLVQVTDSDPAHDIRGVPLRIDFAIRDRRPALDYINGGYSLYDLVAVEGENLTISPMGFDPDDDKLSYTYDGWLEQYNDRYNWADAQCSNRTTLEYVLKYCTIVDTDPITGAVLPALHNWTKSQDYILTGRNASYDVEYKDIGLHTVRVSVVDSQGLNDFQDVKVLVFDKPVAKINGSNGYDNAIIGHDRASYEDMYILNGSDSTVGILAGTIPGSLITAFFWNDPFEPFSVQKLITGDMNSRILLIPNDTGGKYLNRIYIPPSFDIMTISSFNKPSGNKYPDPIVHNISLTITTNLGLEASNELKVNVTECLPHRSSRPSYPYDTMSPFNVAVDDLNGNLQANHTCCTDDFQYEDASIECYDSTAYGRIQNFFDFKNNLPSSGNVILSYMRDDIDNNDNDIYMQTFTRKCSGDRGNVCTGDGTEDIKVTYNGDCDDTNTKAPAAFQKERCSGPPEEYFSANPITSPYSVATPNNPGCADYPAGKTFESLNKKGSGICTTNKQRASGDGGTFGSGNFICNGLCDSKGGCTTADNCECDSNGDSTGNRACDGLSTSDLSSLTSRRDRCDLSAPNYFEDRCDSSCGIEKVSNICRSASFDKGCSASSQCDGKAINTILDSPITCAPGTNRRAKCDNTCQVTPDMTDNVCRTTGANGCILNLACDGNIRNNIITTLTKNPLGNLYCDSSCKTVDCGNYRALSSGGCYATCTGTGATQCSSGHTCTAGVCK